MIVSRGADDWPLSNASTADEFWDVLGAKWTLQIISVLADGPIHFNALKRQLGIPGSTLSARLDTLCEQSIVSRSVENTSPPTVEYSLTPKGNEIATVVDRLIEIERKWTN